MKHYIKQGMNNIEGKSRTEALRKARLEHVYIDEQGNTINNGLQKEKVVANLFYCDCCTEKLKNKNDKRNS